MILFIRAFKLSIVRSFIPPYCLLLILASSLVVVSVGATSAQRLSREDGEDEHIEGAYEDTLQFYGDGMPNPSADAAQFSLFPGEGGGNRYFSGPWNDGLPLGTRNTGRSTDRPKNNQQAGAPIFGLLYVMKVETVCCTCRCDSRFIPSSNANLAPGQARQAACVAHCGVGGPECGVQGAGQFEGFC